MSLLFLPLFRAILGFLFLSRFILDRRRDMAAFAIHTMDTAASLLVSTNGASNQTQRAEISLNKVRTDVHTPPESFDPLSPRINSTADGLQEGAAAMNNMLMHGKVSFFGTGNSSDNACSSSRPCSACKTLDLLENFEMYRNAKSPKLFTDCMDALENAQRQFRVSFPTFDQPCPQPHDLIHTMWTGSPSAVMRLGILSFVRAYPRGCVSVILWTDANSADKIRNDLSQHAGLKAPVLDIRVLDFAKISERLLSVYPALESLLRESQQNLIALSNEKSATPLSDVVRFFVLAAYGGVYLDCDMLLLRQLTPLLANDFFYRWSNQEYCNTAALHFRLGSNNAFTAIKLALQETKGVASRMKNFFHPIHFYQKIKSMNNQGLKIDMLPSAYFDPLWVVDDVYGEGAPAAMERYGLKTFHDFFSQLNNKTDVVESITDQFFPGAFAFHWHNQWKAELRPGSTADLFMREYLLESK